jgi:hypothetical protein
MSFTITIGMTTEQIQTLLDNVNCGYITFQPGTYNLEKSLHINRYVDWPIFTNITETT